MSKCAVSVRIFAVQYLVITYNGKESEKEYMCVCVCVCVYFVCVYIYTHTHTYTHTYTHKTESLCCIPETL